MVSRSDQQQAVIQRFSRHLRLGASLGAVIVVLAACSFGGSATGGAQTSSGDQTGAASATATATATSAVSAPTATATHAPAPTATHAAAPTPTPVPPLQSQIITKSITVPSSGNSQIVDLTCPSGYLVAGGGPKAGYSNFIMMWNAPISATTWQVEAYNTGGAGFTLTEQVVCMKVSGLQSQIISKSLGGIADLTCPAGYLVAGGGPKAGVTNFTMQMNGPINTTTWRAEASGADASYVTAQVVCLKASGLQSQIIVKALNVPATSNSSIADMTCPSGYLVAGGGPEAGYATFTMMQDAPISLTTWQAEAYNTSGSAFTVQEQVVCMKH